MAQFGEGGATGQKLEGDVEVVEKIVKIIDNEKIKETEKRLEMEREKIRLQYEEQRKKIMSQKNIHEEEKKQILKKLKETEEKQRVEREQQEKLLKKIKKMEDKVIQGQSQYEDALEKERILREHQ